jgi:2-polyprenyl-3-methyl-5-hydroxy-6-metoxy-1,4-benzoquinol methylase
MDKKIKIQELQNEAYFKGEKHQFNESLKLGPWTSYSMIHDPKHMCFVLSRYKFVSKMIYGKKKILEIGCGDGFGFPIIAQVADEVHGVDRYDWLLQGNRERLNFLKDKSKFFNLDLVKEVPEEKYDAIFSIDVIEHLEPKDEKKFLENSIKGLKNDGLYIIGTPNISASQYATDRSRVQHINLKNHEELRTILNKYFINGFIFSMNDEVMHTGYYPMAQYLFAMGVGVLNKK